MWRLAHHPPNVRHHRESVSGRSLAGDDRLGCGNHQLSQGSVVESRHRPGNVHCASGRRHRRCRTARCPPASRSSTSPGRATRECHRDHGAHCQPLVRAIDRRSPRLAGDRDCGCADRCHLPGVVTRCTRQVDGDCRAPRADPDGPAGGDRRDAAPPAHVSRMARAACWPREHRGARARCLDSAASGARPAHAGVCSACDRGHGHR